MDNYARYGESTAAGEFDTFASAPDFGKQNVGNSHYVSTPSMPRKPVNCEDVMDITSVTDLRAYGQGQVIRLPDFGDGMPFVAVVRRPSMLVLAKQGKIPNHLLVTANELFAKGGGGLDVDDKNMLSNFYDTCHVICEAALAKPTLQEIESAGVTLTDEQLMAIFNYTQTGVKALQSFRKE